MQALLLSSLPLLLLGCSSALAICERHLLPELSFSLSGRNLDWPASKSTTRNVIATRVQISRNEAIVAMPRFRNSVPATLGILALRSRECKPRIEPFPSWSLQQEGNCYAFQNVVDIALDGQDELWLLDVGIVGTLEQPVRKCPPKVVAVNVRTGKVLKVIQLVNLVNANSRLQHLVVDRASDGRVFLYIADAASRAIIVYDVESDLGYRTILPKTTGCGCKRNNDDVLYLLLVRKKCGAAWLYFTYLSSKRLFSIEADNLRSGSTNGTIVEVGAKQNEIVLLGTDNGCAIFFRNKGQSDVYMWNAETAFEPENFMLVQNGNECTLPTQVVPGCRKLMWVLESNFQDYIRNNVGCTGASVSLHPLVRCCEG